MNNVATIHLVSGNRVQVRHDQLDDALAGKQFVQPNSPFMTGPSKLAPGMWTHVTNLPRQAA